MTTQDQPFPNGLNKCEYDGWENWGRQRWAWEFLRRNPNFRTECKSLPTTKEERIAHKRKIRETFGLRRFKDYREAYAEGKAVEFLALATSPSPESRTSPWSRKLYDDEVCIVFTLLPSLLGSHALDFQMEEARRIVERRAQALRKKLSIERKPTAPRYNRPSLLRKLQLLDARNCDFSWEQIAEALNTRQGKGLHLHYLADAERNNYQLALELADRGYLALLTSKSSRKNLQLRFGEQAGT
ncbi:transcriptional regulator domain-containing protein [Paraburkholderia xenovorans]|uniref:transcriptional regulator domain-containing protein n=1 Tax=Paraburkholderia xenovorans TaxID=36873 RepID=UPI0015C52C3F|nr:DUF6499 domain-containing protein [Paraburkholderia xenovorans]NPT36310.1 hypothetical protein [Paraburkholderia xenovorans]